MYETKKQQFIRICKSLANMESLISDFKELGLLMEPDTRIGHYVYNTCDNIFNVAKSILDINKIDYDGDDWLHDHLMNAKLDTLDQVIEEAWQKYGTD